MSGGTTRINGAVVGSGGASLSTNNPVALGAAAPGSGTAASKDDHVHPTTGLALLAGAAFTADITLATSKKLAGVAELNLSAASGSVINEQINAVTQETIGLGVHVFGAGDATATTTAFTVRGPARTGTDAAASSWTFQAPNGTGAGAQPGFVFQTGLVTGTSSTAQAMTTSLTIGRGLRIGSGTTFDGGDGTINFANGTGPGLYWPIAGTNRQLVQLNTSTMIIGDVTNLPNVSLRGSTLCDIYAATTHVYTAASATIATFDANGLALALGFKEGQTAVKSTAYTILITDTEIYVDPTTPFALQLPNPATVGAGKVYHVVSFKASLLNMTLVRFGSEKINNATSTWTFIAEQGARIYCNGVDWAVV